MQASEGQGPQIQNFKSQKLWVDCLQAERALWVPCTYLACVFPWGSSGELAGDHGEGLKYRWLRTRHWSTVTPDNGPSGHEGLEERAERQRSKLECFQGDGEEQGHDLYDEACEVS